MVPDSVPPVSSAGPVTVGGVASCVFIVFVTFVVIVFNPLNVIHLSTIGVPVPFMNTMRANIR